jgi:predicted nucleic acid-binding protein
MILLDTSVWISCVLPEDVNHVRSRTWLEATLASGEMFTGPSLLAIETAGAVARRLRDPQSGRDAVGQLMRMPDFELIPLSDDLVLSATQIAADLRLRGSDAIFVATAMETGSPLVTLDQEILTRAAGTIAVFSPP